MIVERLPGEVTTWNIVFDPRGRGRISRFIPGHYKHVSAFGLVPACKTWVYLNVELSQTRVYLLPQSDKGNLALEQWIEGQDVLAMEARHSRGYVPPRVHFRAGLTCVGFVKHLVGITGGALLPDTLWRDCIAQGARVLLPESDDARRPAARPEPSLYGRGAASVGAEQDLASADAG